MSNNFVLYRLPHADHYFSLKQAVGEPAELCSYADIGCTDGFVFAPFSVSKETPILLLKPDVKECIPIASDFHVADEQPISFEFNEMERRVYHDTFTKFHSCLDSGEFEKIVLSRRQTVCVDKIESPIDMFKRACSLYPRMFIALVSMRKAGTWLMATPEILLEGQAGGWRTMALAGTMRLTDEQLSFDTPSCNVPLDTIKWSEKNVREQRYVASYINEKLKAFTTNIMETAPYTVRAGRLVHLRSDFKFTLPSIGAIGRIIQELHPTPAVCGMPLSKTYEFIRHNEGFARRYYSGFSGIVNRNGDTQLYVTLRCMQILKSSYNLYAGGGLLRDSLEEQEWAETEFKMETMKRCFVTKKI